MKFKAIHVFSFNNWVKYDLYTLRLLVSYAWLRVRASCNPYFASVSSFLNWKLRSQAVLWTDDPVIVIVLLAGKKKKKSWLLLTYFWSNNYYDEDFYILSCYAEIICQESRMFILAVHFADTTLLPISHCWFKSPLN